MKKTLFVLPYLMAFCSYAMAFNPDPFRYEFIGQDKDSKQGVFYDTLTARADGLKGSVVIVHADPKSRTVRHYNIVLDNETKTTSASQCNIYSYQGELLEHFITPNEAIKYTEGSFPDLIYKDLVKKGIIKLPQAPVIVSNYESNYKPVYRKPIEITTKPTVDSGDWKKGFTGGDVDTDVLGNGTNNL